MSRTPTALSPPFPCMPSPTFNLDRATQCKSTSSSTAPSCGSARLRVNPQLHRLEGRGPCWHKSSARGTACAWSRALGGTTTSRSPSPVKNSPSTAMAGTRIVRDGARSTTARLARANPVAFQPTIYVCHPRWVHRQVVGVITAKLDRAVHRTGHCRCPGRTAASLCPPVRRAHRPAATTLAEPPDSPAPEHATSRHPAVWVRASPRAGA
jgi:hypothetical protein